MRIGQPTQRLRPRLSKEQRRDNTNALSYRPATAVIVSLPTKGTEARPEQRIAYRSANTVTKLTPTKGTELRSEQPHSFKARHHSYSWSALAQPPTVVAGTTGEGADLASVRFFGVGSDSHRVGVHEKFKALLCPLTACSEWAQQPLWWRSRQVRAQHCPLFPRSAWT